MAKFLKLKDVIKLTGLSRSTIYRLIAAGLFPPRAQLSTKRVGWSEDEVLAWCAKTLASRQAVLNKRKDESNSNGTPLTELNAEQYAELLMNLQKALMPAIEKALREALHKPRAD